MKTFDAVLRLLGSHKRFIVTAHHNPDADAAASALALALALKKMKKSVLVLNEDDLPDWLKFLPQARLFKKAGDVKSFGHDAVIVLDCGDLSRIGAVKKFLVPGQPVVNIDHHVTNDRFGTINCLVPTASSTCEILCDIFTEAKVRLDKDMAKLLYAGIMTDTGSFRYENTKASTHAIAARLMEFGLNAQELYDRLYPPMPVADSKLFSELLYKADLVLDKRVYCVSISEKEADRFSKGFDLKERVFAFLRNIQGVEVVAIFNGMKDGTTRINLRSQGKLDVASLAQKFEGGGHRKAAGCKIHAGIATAQKKILAVMAKQLKMI